MTTETISFPWQPLGTIPVAELAEAKLQLHWAAQIVSAFGNALLETQPDDSQSNLGWEDSIGALCSHASLNGLSVGLRFSDLTLLFLSSQNTIQSEFKLSGQALSQALEWLTATYSNVSKSEPPKTFTLRDYDMPSHPVGNNAAFHLGPSLCFSGISPLVCQRSSRYSVGFWQMERSLTHSLLAPLF